MYLLLTIQNKVLHSVKGTMLHTILNHFELLKKGDRVASRVEQWMFFSLHKWGMKSEIAWCV